MVVNVELVTFVYAGDLLLQERSLYLVEWLERMMSCRNFKNGSLVCWWQ